MAYGAWRPSQHHCYISSNEGGADVCCRAVVALATGSYYHECCCLQFVFAGLMHHAGACTAAWAPNKLSLTHGLPTNEKVTSHPFHAQQDINLSFSIRYSYTHYFSTTFLTTRYLIGNRNTEIQEQLVGLREIVLHNTATTNIFFSISESLFGSH